MNRKVGSLLSDNLLSRLGAPDEHLDAQPTDQQLTTIRLSSQAVKLAIMFAFTYTVSGERYN